MVVLSSSVPQVATFTISESYYLWSGHPILHEALDLKIELSDGSPPDSKPRLTLTRSSRPKDGEFDLTVTLTLKNISKGTSDSLECHG